MMNKPGDKKGTIRVLIVDDIPETRENLKKLLAFESDIEVIGMAGTGKDGVEQAREKKPDIILMDINMPDIDGIQATEQIARLVPNAGVVMMSVQHEPEYLRRAMLAGARDFLTKPIAGDELYATIRRVYSIKPVIVAPPPEVGFTETGIPSFSSGPSSGRIIVVYSPQGGIGKTTIATNMAAALLRDNVKVLLVDADLQFGDVGVFLNLAAQNTIVRLLPNAFEEEPDYDLIENVVVKHDSGLRVLLGPPTPQDAEELSAEAVVNIVAKLRTKFDYVIVDTASVLNDLTLGLFDLADRIVLVSSPTLPALKNTRSALNVMEAVGYPDEKVQMVFNRVNPEFERSRITPAVSAIETRLKRTAVASIPSDERKVLMAQTRGTPVFVGKERNTSPAKEFLALADSIINSFAPAPVEQVTNTNTTQQPKTNSRLSRLLGG